MVVNEDGYFLMLTELLEFHVVYIHVAFVSLEWGQKRGSYDDFVCLEMSKY
jgi:hypothetical protein